MKWRVNSGLWEEEWHDLTSIYEDHSIVLWVDWRRETDWKKEGQLEGYYSIALRWEMKAAQIKGETVEV